MKKTNSFILSKTDSKQPEQTVSGHGTTVRFIETLNEPVIEKTSSKTGVYKNKHNLWLNKTRHAAEIQNKLRNLNNHAYFVPKTFIYGDNPRVLEQIAGKQFVSDLSNSEKGLDINKFTYSMGHFINDMSELYPVKTITEPVLRMESIKDENGLKELFEEEILQGLISEKHKKLIYAAFSYLKNLPENKVLIFSHRDFHSKNFMIKEEQSLKLGIIDFELAGFLSQLDLMYSYNLLRYKGLWDFVNKLPRKTNPDLKWEFDKRKALLFLCVMKVIQNLLQYKEKPNKLKQALIKANIEELCERALEPYVQLIYKMGEFKKETSSIVPITFYTKERI